MWHAAVAVGSCAAWAVFAGDDGERVVDGVAAQCAGWLPSGDGFAVPVADGGVAARGGPGVHCGPPPPASLGHPPWLVLCPPCCCVDPLGERHRLVDLVRRHLGGPLEVWAGDGEGLGADTAGGVNCGERGSTEHAYDRGTLAQPAALQLAHGGGDTGQRPGCRAATDAARAEHKPAESVLVGGCAEPGELVGAG